MGERLSARGVLEHQNGVKRLGVARLPKLASDVGIAQQASDPRQRLQMIGAGRFRRQQQEDEIDRLAVERFELHRTVEPGEQAEQMVELGQLAVRYGYAVADSGRAELLALQQNLEDRALALPGELGGAGRQLLERLLLAVDLERRNDSARRDEIA